MNSLLLSPLRLIDVVRPPPLKSLRSESPSVMPDCRYGGPAVTELVIDVSPSMDSTDYYPSRLEGARQASGRFLDTLLERGVDEVVGLVCFSSKARARCAPLPAKAAAEKLRQAIRNLRTSSCTNISAGLSVGSKEIARLRQVKNPRLLLLTDGASNTGPDPKETAAELKNQGIQIDIIGIGGSPAEVNEADLRQMASVVNGELRYWFIESVGELVRRFELLALREIK